MIRGWSSSTAWLSNRFYFTPSGNYTIQYRDMTLRQGSGLLYSLRRWGLGQGAAPDPKPPPCQRALSQKRAEGLGREPCLDPEPSTLFTHHKARTALSL